MDVFKRLQAAKQNTDSKWVWDGQYNSSWTLLKPAKEKCTYDNLAEIRTELIAEEDDQKRTGECSKQTTTVQMQNNG